MHSFLIIGTDLETINKKALALINQVAQTEIRPENEPDLLIIEPESASESLKIEQIRQLKKDLSIRPIQLNQKIGLIKQAHQLTPAAQNSLLKTLEEPPGQTVMILTSTQPDLLLDTIRSRCQLIKTTASQTNQTDLAQQAEWAEKIIQSNQAERLLLTDRLGPTQENLLSFIAAQTTYWHQELLRSDSVWTKKQILRALKALQEGQKAAKTQVNTLLVFDHLLNSFPSPKN